MNEFERLEKELDRYKAWVSDCAEVRDNLAHDVVALRIENQLLKKKLSQSDYVHSKIMALPFDVAIQGVKQIIQTELDPKA